MAFERPLPTTTGPGERGNRQVALEEAINLHLEAINQNLERGTSCTNATECLRVAVRELAGNCGGERGREARACLATLLDAVRDIHPPHKTTRDKTEKDEENQRARMNWSSNSAEVRKRVDSLRRAVAVALHPAEAIKAASTENPCSWELLPAPREFADSRRSSAVSDSGNVPDVSVSDVDEAIVQLFPLCGSQSSKSPEALSSKSSSPYLLGPALNLESVNSGSCANLTKLGDTPEPAEGPNICDVRLFRVPSLVVSDTALTPTDENVENISFNIGDMYESDKMTIIDMDIPYTMEVARNNECTTNNERIPLDSPCKALHSPEEDLSDVLSAMSNEECSLGSDGLDHKAFHPTQVDDDNNEHINHIDSPETSDTTCPNSETIHGESMLDDMSSVLGQDLVMAMVGKNGDMESTFTDETTLFTSETTSELPLDSRNPSLEKYDDRIFNFLRRVRKTSKELEEKFGFENKVFNISSNNEPIKYCSLAQFVEGNDIARKSFKKHLRQSKKMNNKKDQQGGSVEHFLLCEETEIRMETRRGSCSNVSGVASIGGETVILNRGNTHLTTRIKEDFDGESSSQKDNSSILDGKFINTAISDVPKMNSFLNVGGNDEQKSSRTNLLSLDVEMDDDIDDRPKPSMFPRVSVVVEPPSPSSSEGKKGLGGNGLSVGLGFTGGLGPAWPRERRCSDNGPRTSLDVERCSSATRRISCGSLFQPGEADRLSKSASSIWGGSHIKNNINKGQKQLPIINPLVRLPAWPHVEGGLVGRCLLANADALCAAVSPLMDPQETLLEGFYERSVMNNYFGIGIDAKISLDFHQKREEHPEKCRSRARNYMWYGVLGSREWLQRTYRHLGQRVQLECDGQRIPLPELQGIVVLNIPSFMGGTNFWGSAGGPHSPFLPPSFDDRVLEVVAVFGSAQMAASRLINLQRHRIAQCRNVQINILGTEGVPVQVDGEAWLQPPGMIRIMHKNRAQVLCRSRQLETSLKSWGEKQKLGVMGVGAGGGSGGGSLPPSGHLSVEPPPDELPAAELAQLLIFIETANTLVKWVKMSSITGTGSTTAGGASSSTGASGSGSCLYDRACTAANAVDSLTPGGRLLPANQLRAHLATLARVLGELCTAAEAAGGGPPLQQAVRSARQQLALVRDQGGLASLQPPDSEAEQVRSGRRGWLRGAASRRASSAAAGTSQGAVHWDTAEVGAWLASLQLAEYAEVFAKHDVTGKELSTLARRDLKDMGITKVGHVKRILQAIKDLQ